MIRTWCDSSLRFATKWCGPGYGTLGHMLSILHMSRRQISTSFYFLEGTYMHICLLYTCHPMCQLHQHPILTTLSVILSVFASYTPHCKNIFCYTICICFLNTLFGTTQYESWVRHTACASIKNLLIFISVSNFTFTKCPRG